VATEHDLGRVTLDSTRAQATDIPSVDRLLSDSAFAALLDAATPLAAVAGNLARLSLEYRRSVRRAHALQDVLLPELDGTVADLETRLEELEQEDAIWMRSGL